MQLSSRVDLWTILPKNIAHPDSLVASKDSNDIVFRSRIQWHTSQSKSKAIFWLFSLNYRYEP